MSELNSNIYLNSANKNWVVDRFRKEWIKEYKEIFNSL